MLGVAAEAADYLPHSPGLAAGDFAVGLAFIAGGALALRRSTATGLLLAATGFAWFLGGIWTMRSNGKALRQLTRGPKPDFQPDWGAR